MYNNWSFSTASNVPLFLPGPLNKVTSIAFPVVMPAVGVALDKRGDLGPWRRPQPCMSNYFSEHLTAYLKAFWNGKDAAYAPGKNMNAVLDTICADDVKEFTRRQPRPAPVAAGHGNHQPRAGKARKRVLVRLLVVAVDEVEGKGVVTPVPTAPVC